jgi:hypothetical protein
VPPAISYLFLGTVGTCGSTQSPASQNGMPLSWTFCFLGTRIPGFPFIAAGIPTGIPGTCNAAALPLCPGATARGISSRRHTIKKQAIKRRLPSLFLVKFLGSSNIFYWLVSKIDIVLISTPCYLFDFRPVQHWQQNSSFKLVI